MKTKFIVLLLIVLMIKCSVAYAKLEVSLAKTYIPGSFNYITETKTYNNGSFVSNIDGQGEVNANLNIAAIRFLFLKHLGFINLGIETGIDIPLESTKLSWFQPARDNYTGTITFPKGYADNSVCESNIETKIETWSIPLLLKLNYDTIKFNSFICKAGLSFGPYITTQMINTTETLEYKYTQGTANVGDVLVNGKHQMFTSFNTIIELTAGLDYNVSETFSLGVLAKIGSLSKYSLVTRKETTLKTEYEYGGAIYGFGIGANYKF